MKSESRCRKIIILCCLIILMSNALISCNEAYENSEVVGAWVKRLSSSDLWYIFNPDKTGQAYSIRAGADEFTWTEENGALTMELVHANIVVTWEFSIDDNIMTVTRQNDFEVDYTLYREDDGALTSSSDFYLTSDFQIQDFIDKGEEFLQDFYFFVDEIGMGGVVTVKGKGNEELIYTLSFDSAANDDIDINVLEEYINKTSFEMQEIANRLLVTWDLESLIVTVVYESYEGVKLISYSWIAE